MKEKTITIKVNGALQGQWSTFIVRVKSNEKSMETLWCYINMKASGLKNILNHGTKVNDVTKNDDLIIGTKRKDPKYKKLWYNLINGLDRVLNDGLYHLIVTKQMMDGIVLTNDVRLF